MGHTLAKAARDFPGGGMAGASWDVDELRVLPICERSGVCDPRLFIRLHLQSP
jgi:hypothetical protein